MPRSLTDVSRGVIEQGRRVYLRSPRASDEDEFLRLVRESRSLHRPWVYPPETPREFAAFVARSRSPSDRCLLVGRREDDALVGVYTVSQIARGFFQNAYLGYYAFAPTGVLRATTGRQYRSPSTRSSLNSLSVRSV